jgi:hypothetical protein
MESENRDPLFALSVVCALSLALAVPVNAQDNASTTRLPVSVGETPQAGGQDSGSAVPRLVRFSGVVKDSTGRAQTGVVAVTFSLYELQDGGTPLWVETQKVQADEQGGYTVLLGATQPDGIPLDLFATGKARWLGIQPQLQAVGELPRILLVGVPYALKAADADTLGGRPASAFVTVENQATSPDRAASLNPALSAGNGVTALPLQASPSFTCSGCAGNFIPLFTDSAGDLTDSVIFQGTVGNVGIGTSSPGTGIRLDVSGKGRISGGLDLSSAGSMLGFNRNVSSGQIYNPAYNAFQIGQNTADQSFQVQQYGPSGTGMGTPFFVRSTGDVGLAIGNGWVGIGTYVPTAPLDVVGSMKIEVNGSGIIFPDGTMQTTANLQGPQGPIGPVGPRGPQGPPGPPSHTMAVCLTGSPSAPQCAHGYEVGPQKGPCTVTSDTGSCSGLQDTTGPYGCAVCKP